MRNLVLFSCLLCASVTFAAFAETPPSAVEGPYAESAVFAVGGEGRWDFLTVDTAGKRLFVPRTTHTMVLDEATGKTLADIPGQKGNHGVAVVAEANRGFITDGKDASVVVFDLKSYAVLGKIKAAEDADGIIYDTASGMVLVTCGDAAALAIFVPSIDLSKDATAELVPLGGKPEFLATDDQGKVYINLENKAEVAVVDIKAKSVLNKWPVAPGGMPVGMAIDKEHRRLFVGCRNPQTMVVMSADDGKVLADLPIGKGVDATVFDDATALASCGDGTLTAIRETSAGKFEVVQTVKTRSGAKTMGVDPQSHQIFLPCLDIALGTAPNSTPHPFIVVVVSPSRK